MSSPLSSDSVPRRTLADIPTHTLPVRWRAAVLAAVVLHLLVVFCCLCWAFRSSALADRVLDVFEPYAIGANYQQNYMSLATENAWTAGGRLRVLLYEESSNEHEANLLARIGEADPQRGIYDWRQLSDTADAGWSQTRRQARWLRHLEALYESGAESATLDLLLVMVKEVEDERPGLNIQRIQVVRPPELNAQEWDAAQDLLRSDSVPNELHAELLIDAAIIRRAGKIEGVVRQLAIGRVAPVVAPEDDQ